MGSKRKAVFVVCLLLVICCLSGGCQTELQQSSGQGQWRLGVQAYTFNRFTFYEAIDKTKALGLDSIEGYSFGQRLSREKRDVRFGHNMPKELRVEVKEKLKKAGVKLVNYYALLSDNQEQCRSVFDFAKDMGAETIVAEPQEESLDMIEGLCREYKIKVAIHNHPKSSRWNRYWDPEKVSAVCQGRSEWIGACIDTGHWLRSGIKPVDAMKKLEGRIVSVHLKDLNRFGDPKAHDVIWGKGKSDIAAILVELKEQDFNGVISIEYEHNWENSMPEIKKCVRYFRDWQVKHP